MPVYVYKCPVCDFVHHDYQSKYTGSREIQCPKCSDIEEHLHFFPGGYLMQRDYNAEKASIIPDWEPGYNPGIDYNYTSKADLMGEIKRRGLYSSVHGGGVSVGGSKSGLYGDEQYRDMYNSSKPIDMEGLTNEPAVTKQ